MRLLIKNNSNFRKFYCAVTISSIGDYVDDIAFAQLVYLATNSTALTGFVFGVKIVFSFFSIFTSALADRLNKKILVFCGDFSQVILLLILFGIHFFGQINTIILMLFVSIQAFFSTVATPAKNALLPMIVEKEELLSARATLSANSQFIRIFSYALSAALINILGIAGCLLIDTLSFFISSFLFLSLKYESLVIPYCKPGEFIRDIQDGFRYIKTLKIVMAVMLLTFIGNILTSPLDALLPAYFTQGSFPVSAYSIYMAVLAIGGLTASLFLPYLSRKFSQYSLFALGFGFGSIGMILLVFNIFPVPFICAFFIGVSYTLVSVLNANLIQYDTPKEMTARIFSIFKFLSFIANPAGLFLIGFAGEYFNMNWLYFSLGICMCFLALGSYLSLNIVQKKLYKII